MSPVTLHYGNVLASALGERGIRSERIPEELSSRFAEVYAEVEARRASGELGFFALPHADHARQQVQEVADSFGQWFEALVVVGIGGSSLGARAVSEALLGPFWNELDDEERDHFPKLYFLENADPDTTRALLDRLDLRTTLFNIVSKSGSTAETMAQFLVIEEALREAVGVEGVRGHLLFTTDPELGVLRRLAESHEIPALPVPPNVGGRFSVLSPVGLLPAAVTGVDVEALLAGAAEMEARCATGRLERNPAGMLAVLLHAAHREMGCSVQVLMPYGDRLRAFALWFQQLWGESLGKALNREGTRVESGPTPIAALGAVDQHSLLQLLMEGPRDKIVVFVKIGERADPVPIPRLFVEHPALAYLGGHTLEELLDVERRATTEALRREGRPSLTLEVERLDARTLGALFMLFQITTVYAGALYGVDPMDQPGVELGKRLTYGLLGREGVEVPDLPPEDVGPRV